MKNEYDALVSNGTWSFVPQPPGVNVITGKWLFTNKLHPYGTLERHKAHWVVRGFTQCAGVDFHQTFSSVIKPTTIQTVLHLAASRNWSVQECVFTRRFGGTRLLLSASWFVEAAHPDHVCLLVNSFIALNKCRRHSSNGSADIFRSIGFTATCADSSLLCTNAGLPWHI